MAMVSGTSQASLSRLGCILKVRNLKGKKWNGKVDRQKICLGVLILGDCFGFGSICQRG